MDYTETENYIAGLISHKRYHHILGTVEISRTLAKRFHPDEQEAAAAALWHDAAREFPEERLRREAERVSSQLLELERNIPVLLHSIVSAEIFMREQSQHEFSPEASDRIWRAIRWHTLAHPDMGELGFVLFIADYCEPGRRHISPAEREHLLSLGSLEEMMEHVLRSHFAHLAEKGEAEISPSAARLYELICAQ